MLRFKQLFRKARRRKKLYTRTKSLRGSPQRKGICLKVYTTKPKKPNSAIRKVAKVYLTGPKKNVIAAIPGVGHTLSNFSHVMVRGGRVRDLPGVHYKLVRGLLDFIGKENVERGRKRSKYGLPRRKLEDINVF